MPTRRRDARVHRSLNQVEQTCRKAARAAGLPWGIADEVGQGIRWLAYYGFDALPLVVDLFDHIDHTEFAKLAARGLTDHLADRPRAAQRSPILFGVALSDYLSATRIAPLMSNAVAYPLLAVGIAAYAAQLRARYVRFSWGQVSLGVYAEYVQINPSVDPPPSDPRAAAIASQCAELVCDTNLMSGGDKIFGQTNGTLLAPKVWARLEDYAQRTYVDASAASRLAGAGAGLEDND